MKRLVKGIILLLFLCLVVAVMAFSRFQQIINEEVSLTDERCLKINPIVIERKNAYLASIKSMVTYGKEAFIVANKEYIDISKRNIETEEKWSKKYKNLLDRWDFKLLTPTILQRISRLQWESYAYDREATRNTVIVAEGFFKGGLENNPELKEAGENLAILTKQRNDAEAELEVLVKDPNLYNDFRISLIHAPKSKCPAENQKIPDVKMELEKILYPESSPSAPVDPTSPAG